jgi:hypothetical protein
VPQALFFAEHRLPSRIGYPSAWPPHCLEAAAPFGTLRSRRRSARRRDVASPTGARGAEHLEHRPNLLAGNGNLTVYSYPQGKYVGRTRASSGGFTGGECVDSTGDVFVTSTNGPQDYYYGEIYEFAYGGLTPIATLADPNWNAAA